MHTTRTRRALAAFASTAVAAAGFTALAPAAQAATTTLTFKCSVSILTGQVFTLDVTPQLPATAEAGSTIAAKFAGSVTVPKTTVEAAYAFLNVRSLEGSADVQAKFGAADEQLKAALPKTDLPASGDLTVPVAGSGSWKAGATLGPRQVTIPGFSAPLTMTKADKSTQDATVTCVADAPATVVGSVEIVEATKPPVVVKSSSKTTAMVKYSKKSKKATVTTSVKVGKKAASGKVKIKLAKGKKTVKTVTVKLKRGKASASFKKISKKGKYTATVSYAGSSSVKKSSKKVTFRVK